MNRQERRRNERKKQTTYNLTPEQLLTLQDKALKQAEDEFFKNWNEKKKELYNEAFLMFIWVPLLTARDHLGFGQKRLKSFAEAMLEVYNAWDNELITSDDILEALKDETGLELEMSVDYRNQKTELTLK